MILKMLPQNYRQIFNTLKAIIMQSTTFLMIAHQNRTANHSRLQFDHITYVTRLQFIDWTKHYHHSTVHHHFIFGAQMIFEIWINFMDSVDCLPNDIELILMKFERKKFAYFIKRLLSIKMIQQISIQKKNGSCFFSAMCLV